MAAESVKAEGAVAILIALSAAVQPLLSVTVMS